MNTDIAEFANAVGVGDHGSRQLARLGELLHRIFKRLRAGRPAELALIQISDDEVENLAGASQRHIRIDDLNRNQKSAHLAQAMLDAPNSLLKFRARNGHVLAACRAPAVLLNCRGERKQRSGMRAGRVWPKSLSSRPEAAFVAAGAEGSAVRGLAKILPLPANRRSLDSASLRSG